MLEHDDAASGFREQDRVGQAGEAGADDADIGTPTPDGPSASAAPLTIKTLV